jgi:hypothetical protein
VAAVDHGVVLLHRIEHAKRCNNVATQLNPLDFIAAANRSGLESYGTRSHPVPQCYWKRF